MLGKKTTSFFEYFTLHSINEPNANSLAAAAQLMRLYCILLFSVNFLTAMLAILNWAVTPSKMGNGKSATVILPVEREIARMRTQVTDEQRERFFVRSDLPLYHDSSRHDKKSQWRSSVPRQEKKLMGAQGKKLPCARTQEKIVGNDRDGCSSLCFSN